MVWRVVGMLLIG